MTELQLANENQLALVAFNSPSPFKDLLISQKDLFLGQIEELENIVLTQSNLTGVNPLSQEMAAGALSIQIGKRPRDLLNPKAIKYMQSLFSIKDAITKKETREISALYGVTATQVREFFTSQRARVRKFIRLSQEKANRSSSCKEVPDGIPMSSDSNDIVSPVPLDSIAPTSMDQGFTSSSLDGVTEDQSDKYFIDNIFNLMRKEESFSGQVKLMEWIMQIQNASVLYWFLTNSGVMILATWLTQALLEEQTSVLRVILKVLCHLPLQKALPVHMSAILQSVNSLRFYRVSDVSNRARILLTRWSKTFARSQALRKTSGTKSAIDAQDEMLLKQSISEVMDSESWHTNIDNHEDNSTHMDESQGNFRKLESQPVKLLTASADDLNKKFIRGSLSSQNRERRKVLLVEQPGQKSSGRTSQISRSTSSTQGRPLSADDIQKAKMRAQFMQSKHGKANTTSDTSHMVQAEGSNKGASSHTGMLLPTPKTHAHNEIEEPRKCDLPLEIASPQNVLEPRKCDLPLEIVNPQNASIDNKINSHSDEPPWKKCKRFQIPWQTPPEILVNASWSIGTGEHSKEVEVQKNRIHREREIVYKTLLDIPSDPKEPWDREIDYDDSLTPEIPIEQLPDVEGAEALVSPRDGEGTAGTFGVLSSQNAVGMPEPDLELLAALLKNPQLVFALTSGQAGNLSNEETVKFLDMIKANETNAMSSVSASSGKGKLEEKVEVSLPSPTPSNDTVTGAWKPDYAKNPFSLQKTIITHDACGTPRSSAAVPSQEKILASNMVQSRALPNRSVVSEQSTAFPQMEQHSIAPVLHSEEKLRASSLVPPPHVVGAQQSTALNPLAHQILPQVFGLPDQRFSPVTSSSLQQNVSAYIANTQLRPASELVLNANHVSISRLPQLTNSLNAVIPAVHDTSFPTTTAHRSQTQLQPSYTTEAPPAHPWWSRQGVDQMARYQSDVNPNEYSAFAGAPVRAPVPPSWEKNDMMGDPDFQSWSPENSPMRSHHRYMPGWNLQELRVNQAQSYRPERQIPRHSTYPSSSGYQEWGMNESKRWRDRRR